MPGKKGQKAWNKREEFDWRELIGENKTLLSKLGKRIRIECGDFEPETIEAIMNDPNKRKLFFKALDIAIAICVKSIPQKLEGAGEGGEIVIRIERAETNENYLQAPRFAIPDIQ